MPVTPLSACTPFSCEVRPVARIQLGSEATEDSESKDEKGHQLVTTALARQMLEQHNEVIREIHALTSVFDRILEKRQALTELRLEECFAAHRAGFEYGEKKDKAGEASIVLEQSMAGVGPSVRREATDIMKQTAPPDLVTQDNKEVEQVMDSHTMLRNFHHAQNLSHAYSRLTSQGDNGDFTTSLEPSDSTFFDTQKNRLTRAVVSNTFDMISGALVIMNSVYMAVELELKGIDTGSQLGVDGYTGEPPLTLYDFFGVMEHVFCILFIIEMLLRILVHGKKFFMNFLNCVDCFVVVMAALENYILVFVGYTVPDISAIRLIRLVKLVKAMRVMRVMAFLHPLRVLLVSIVSAVGALFWSLILLAVLQVIASIGITQALHDFLHSKAEDIELQKEVFAYFGRWSYSMLTMFEITVGPGAWAKIGRTLIFRVSGLYVLFFVPYVSAVTFAIMRVITAIFLKSTMAAAAQDVETAYHERVLKNQKDTERLQKIFEDGDIDKGGDMTRREFKTLFRDQRVRAWLAEMGLDVREAEGLFSLLDDGDGLITFQEFISGILRLRGGAKTLDLATLLLENKKIHLKLDHLRNSLGIAKEGEKKAKMKAIDLFTGKSFGELAS